MAKTGWRELKEEISADEHIVWACGASTGHGYQPIAFCKDAGTAQAVVRASNNFDALVSALEEVTNALAQTECGPRIDSARAILAKCREA